MVGLAPGGPEHRQQPVADELVDAAAVVVDDRDDLLEQTALIAATTSSAGVRSANDVKSRMSTNMIVTSTCSPARLVPSSRMCAATSGST